MAKNIQSAISDLDILEFIKNSKDFSFELQVLNILKGEGYSCTHGGYYKDPDTNKNREYDIRAEKSIGNLKIHLAVECKNLSQSSPIVFKCTDREHDYCFLDSLVKWGRYFGTIDACINSGLDNNNLYKIKDPVAQSISRLTKLSSGSIKEDDSDIFDKWSQALQSLTDMFNSAVSYIPDDIDFNSYSESIFIPIVVFPDDVMWVAHYDNNGELNYDPERSNRISYKICRVYNGVFYAGGGIEGEPEREGDVSYTVSHIEFVTTSGLMELIKTIQENI